MSETINAVIQVYGAYSAALEREYVRSQQRTDAPVILEPRERTYKDAVVLRDFIRTYRVWWTVDRLSAALGMDRRYIVTRINGLVNQDHVERKYPAINGRMAGIEQSYRWVK